MNIELNQKTQEDIGMLLSIILMFKYYFVYKSSSNSPDFNENDNYLGISDWG